MSAYRLLRGPDGSPAYAATIVATGGIDPEAPDVSGAIVVGERPAAPQRPTGWVRMEIRADGVRVAHRKTWSDAPKCPDAAKAKRITHELAANYQGAWCQRAECFGGAS